MLQNECEASCEKVQKCYLETWELSLEDSSELQKGELSVLRKEKNLGRLLDVVSETLWLRMEFVYSK